jgi:hypothetical protein
MAPRKVVPSVVYSCVDCLAWGVVGARRCKSCATLRHMYPGGDGECAGCRRVLALKRGYCRLCWQQAAYESKTVGGSPRGAVSVLESGGPRHGHQLFFDRMKLRRGESEARKYGHRRGAPLKPPPAPVGRPAVRAVQLRLFEAHRDFTRFEESTSVDLTNPWLRWAIYLAYQRGEARGWRRGVRIGVRRGLTIVLSAHAAGDVVRWSELSPVMRALWISTERVAEVLQEMGVLLDDRRPTFETWLHRKLDGLARALVPAPHRDRKHLPRRQTRSRPASPTVGIRPRQPGLDGGRVDRYQPRGLVTPTHRRPRPRRWPTGWGLRNGKAMIATLRHRLLCVPARLIRHASQLTLRLSPGHHLLTEILTRLRALPAAS